MKMAIAGSAGWRLLLLAAPLFAPVNSGAVANEVQTGTKVLPINKVLQMLNEMVVKGTKAKQAEKNRFSAFWQWCGDQTRIKNDEIAAGNARIEMLTAKIEKMAALIKALTARINELTDDVARWQTDTKSATDVRFKEAADYKATAADFTESLDALTEAIAVLKKQAYNREQSNEVEEALLQVSKQRLVPIASKKALVAFLQQPNVEEMPSSDLFWSAPEAYSYEFQSGGIIEMLEKLKAEFATKKYEMDREELTAQHAFEQLLQLLADNIENAEHEISKKKILRAETEQAKAEAEADRADTIKERDEDQKYLDEMTALCDLKKTDFESREKLRAEELEALQKAIEIISGEAVKGAGEKYLPTMLQVNEERGVSLAQVLHGSEKNPLQGRIAKFLAERAQRLNSRVLSLASERVAADPFVKVKKMIKDLIVRLMEEGTAETEHKGWCDTELGTNKLTRDRKTAEVNKLTTEIEEMNALIAQLAQSIEELTAAIKELDAAMAKATAERLESKALNEQTIADAKDAQIGVQQAIAILKDYYAKSAQATALAQQTPAEDAPETFDKPYRGMLPEGGSVIDFLEVILTDFARLEAETTSAEEQEVAEYKKFMFESEKDRALKDNEKGHKEEKKSDTETRLGNAEAELKMTQEQLDAAIAYYEKLKPTCVDTGISYEERVRRREEEIQSLEEALAILTGQDIDLKEDVA